jgi:hypothetical protein
VSAANFTYAEASRAEGADRLDCRPYSNPRGARQHAQTAVPQKTSSVPGRLRFTFAADYFSFPASTTVVIPASDDPQMW